MIIDIFCVLAMALGFWMGYSRGIVKTVFALFSLFFGLLIALKFAPVTTNLIGRVFNSEGPLIFVAGFVVTFVAIMLLVRLLGGSIEKLLIKIKINFLNKFAGGALLSVAMVVVFSVLLWFTDRAGIIKSATKEESVTYPMLVELPGASQTLVQKVRPLFEEFWQDSEKFFDDMKVEG